MNMKKTYRRPQARSIALQGPELMLTGSVAVNEYRRDDIGIGDSDEEEEKP